MLTPWCVQTGRARLDEHDDMRSERQIATCGEPAGMTVMMTLRSIIGWGLAVFGGVIVAWNAFLQASALVTRERVPSPIPIIGGVLCCVGMLVLPVAGVRQWGWVPVAVDPGGPAFAMVCMLVYWLRGDFKRSS